MEVIYDLNKIIIYQIVINKINVLDKRSEEIYVYIQLTKNDLNNVSTDRCI